jgi:HPt (histidine-containing phosphotransfer) domain-containing protein
MGQRPGLLPFVLLERGKVANDCKGLVGMSFVMSTNGPPSAGANSELAILDEEHLGRMTLGDRRLEREVLEIFVRHSATMLDLILDCAAEDRAAAAAAAHTMIGAARAVGAWRVAQAAEQIERAVDAAGGQELDAAIAALKAASLEVNATIATRLADPGDRAVECA